jgi:hypothetical protein
VRYIYYGILALYAVGGLAILWFLPAFRIATIGVVLGNLGLGFSTLQALYVNRVLLPITLRPNAFQQLGTAICGVFFLAISMAVMWAYVASLTAR